jgi:nitrite reductase/ring-hydroxylating ferredoxin subunit
MSGAGHLELQATRSCQPAAPAASDFPTYPVSWYLLGHSRELRTRPLARDIVGKRLVAFRTSQGRPVLLEARCCHLGADLSLGCVRGDTIQCPFHQWEFDPSGACVNIPVTSEIPHWARQTSYPIVERHGLLFFFNAPEPLYPLPFFADCRPEDLIRARPFESTLDCPWYMVSANAFDQQHFRAAHDRRMVGEPHVDCPTPYSRRATGTFDVCSDSLQDRITRALAGPQVTLSSTDYGGTLLFTTATFHKTRSFGMVCTEPLGGGKTRVRVVAFLPRSNSAAMRLLDPCRVEVRRFFIKKFLSADAVRLKGTRYNPGGLIAADRELAAYFTWLAHVASALPWREANEAALASSEFRSSVCAGEP